MKMKILLTIIATGKHIEGIVFSQHHPDPTLSLSDPHVHVLPSPSVLSSSFFVLLQQRGRPYPTNRFLIQKQILRFIILTKTNLKH
ncbi:hypothetical protein VNO77_21293 [Canavalia gladiata]|uniref:Uncharacterized protein n=1 Tax=Canavalia gladiata TaxID=3824 RepID=A0AAN9LRQ3_CANGL